MASSATRDEAACFAWLEIDKVKLKNKTRAVAVYALAGGEAYAAGEDFQRLSGLHQDMLTAYRARKFTEAKAAAAAAEPLAPREVAGLYQYYKRRLADLADLELDVSWTPMIALDEK